MVFPVLKLACKYKLDLLISAINAYLTAGVFRFRCEVASLELIGNRKGDPDAPPAYHLLIKMGTAGRLPEKLIKLRLTNATCAPGTTYYDAMEEVVKAVKQTE